MSAMVDAMPPRVVPDAVRSRLAHAGDQSWLAELPDLVASLERDWSLTVGRSYDGGSEAFVADATLENGTEAVLKVFIPRLDDSVRNEITVLRLADGDGCVRLLRSDLPRRAMLLERLGGRLGESGLPRQQRREILVASAERLWRVRPDTPLPTGAEKGRWLIDFIQRMWELLDRPCSEAAVAYAIACAERRIAAHDDARAVLVHGDIHEWNALASDSGYKLIDPDGLLAEPEYDLGVIMREDPIDPADPRASARSLAQRTGLDETATWEWASVERLSTGLICARLNYDQADDLLAAAEHAAQLDA
jgi:streptomycin 6-kinase